jgi:hypothetical protein
MLAGPFRMPRFLTAAALPALIFTLIISCWIDADNVVQGGAIDLRNRITGARLLAAGIDPYTYKWTLGDPEIYCDPYNNPRVTVSKTTSSPAMLALTMPWGTLPYRNGQYCWFMIEWALLLGCGTLWWLAARERWQRLLLGAIFALFTIGASWRLHAERGQNYVVLAFLLAFWLAGTLRAGRGWAFAAGFAGGWLAAARPPCLLLLPVLAWRRRDQIPGMAAGLALGIGLPMLFLPEIWGDYFHGMQQQAYYYLNWINPPPGKYGYPALIENISVLKLAHFVPIVFADGSVHALLRAWGLEPVSGVGVFLLGVLPFAVWCLWALRRQLDLPRLLLGLAIWMYLLDFFLPAYRNTYNDVFALNILALGLLVTPRFWLPLIPAALAFVVDVYVYIASPEINWLIDLPGLLFGLSAVLYLFAPHGDGPMLDTRAAPRQNGSC